MFFHDITDENNTLRFCTSECEGAERVNTQYYELKHEPLAKCPFCGGAAAAYPGSIYTANCVKIKCESCGCGTHNIFEGCRPFTNPPKYISLADALHLAVDRWNHRLTQTV